MNTTTENNTAPKPAADAGPDCAPPIGSVPPSWFASQGMPHCSMWGKTEVEVLAWVYVAAMARDGDTWHEMTAEQCAAILTEEEKRYAAPYLGGVARGRYADWWAGIRKQLTSADGAFEVGGLAWGRHRHARQNTEVRHGGETHE